MPVHLSRYWLSGAYLIFHNVLEKPEMTLELLEPMVIPPAVSPHCIFTGSYVLDGSNMPCSFAIL